MTRHLCLVSLWLALFACFSAAPASAQAPKVGDYYEDAVDIGFKVKMPKDWAYTPPQPDETTLIGKYTPEFNRYINISPDQILWLEAYLVKFDRRAASKEGGEDAPEPRTPGDFGKNREELRQWVESNIRGQGFRVTEEKERKVDKVEALEVLYTAQQGGVDFHVYAMLYQVRPDVDVAVVFNAPADKKWRKYESALSKMAKSFKKLEVEEVEYSGSREGDSPARSKKRGELEAECAKNPGWELYETDNYFVITDNDDREFIKELMDRLEAIRSVYEEIYPWDKAERIRMQAAKAEAEAGEAEEEGEKPDARTSTEVSSRELSRCSVVRIFKNKTQYHEYGGPGGSAGYWASFHEELVIYDDKAGGGRRDTWAVLNHEAFHQYIFYLYGSLAPHSWYNEGTGDFFSGYQYQHKKFKLKPFDWRTETIKTAIKENKHVPLKDLVRFSQREYYGNNKFGVGGGQNYAQGWSFIYFLRTGKGRAPKWNSDWEQILDVYFETLASTEDLDKAVDTAFAGVDWDAMEESWKAYTLKG